MAMPNKKNGDNCLDILSKKYGSLELVSLDNISRNILRIIKDIAYGNITKEDFEKYGSFFTNRQFLIAMRDFAINRKNISNMYVETFDAAIQCGKSGQFVSRQFTQQPQPQVLPQLHPMQPQAVIQQPQTINQVGNTGSSPMWGSILGNQPNNALATPQPYTAMPTINYQYQPVQNVIAPQPIVSNPFDLGTNGLFAQIYDLECRKNNLWTYISDTFVAFEMNYEIFIQEYIIRYLGLQTSLNNQFRRDFALLDK